MPARAAARSKTDIRHKEGCPADRIESYPTTRPNGDAVTVTRCQDCAEQVVTSGAPSSGRSSDGDEDEDPGD